MKNLTLKTFYTWNIYWSRWRLSLGDIFSKHLTGMYKYQIKVKLGNWIIDGRRCFAPLSSGILKGSSIEANFIWEIRAAHEQKKNKFIISEEAHQKLKSIKNVFAFFLDALASLDSKLWVGESVTFSASASTGLSDCFWRRIIMLRLFPLLSLAVSLPSDKTTVSWRCELFFLFLLVFLYFTCYISIELMDSQLMVQIEIGYDTSGKN